MSQNATMDMSAEEIENAETLRRHYNERRMERMLAAREAERAMLPVAKRAREASQVPALRSPTMGGIFQDLQKRQDLLNGPRNSDEAKLEALREQGRQERADDEAANLVLFGNTRPAPPPPRGRPLISQTQATGGYDPSLLPPPPRAPKKASADVDPPWMRGLSKVVWGPVLAGTQTHTSWLLAFSTKGAPVFGADRETVTAAWLLRRDRCPTGYYALNTIPLTVAQLLGLLRLPIDANAQYVAAVEGGGGVQRWALEHGLGANLTRLQI
jgi:hypothetical protein